MEENSQELKRADYIIGIITLLIIVLLLGLSVLMFLETRSLQDELAEEQQINTKLANDILWLQEYYELMEETWALEAEIRVLEEKLSLNAIENRYDFLVMKYDQMYDDFDDVIEYLIYFYENQDTISQNNFEDYLLYINPELFYRILEY